jgi:S-adenosylmethionine:tRNA ribosyltransferase-isomerase
MRTDLFDYDLPKDRIAQEPVRPRDHSRLLVLNRETGDMKHHRFHEINDFLKPGDLLVVNETKVFNARLLGEIDQQTIDNKQPRRWRGEQTIEVFLLRPEQGNNWIVLAKPGKLLDRGSAITFQNNVSCTVQKKRSDGTIIATFNRSPDEIIAWTDIAGSVPVPPYIKKAPDQSDDYQTVYAKEVGSVAAPTAGFHFTPELIEKLKAQGIKFATLTLHVGLGTFRPVKTETIEEHEMHEEWIGIPKETQELTKNTKREGGRVIAVGTTTVRALESDVNQGFTNLFITPGYKFKTVDAMITNFHLPKSTLMVLVSSFAGEKYNDSDDGRKMILRAYEEAKRESYRFYSFGDAMMIQ